MKLCVPSAGDTSLFYGCTADVNALMAGEVAKWRREDDQLRVIQEFSRIIQEQESSYTNVLVGPGCKKRKGKWVLEVRGVAAKPLGLYLELFGKGNPILFDFERARSTLFFGVDAGLYKVLEFVARAKKFAYLSIG